MRWPVISSVRQLGSQGRIPGRGIIGNVNRSDLVVGLEFRSRLRERRASDRRHLISLTDKIVEGNRVLVVDLVIQFSKTVVAVSVLRIRAGIVVRARGASECITGPEIGQEGGADGILRDAEF